MIFAPSTVSIRYFYQDKRCLKCCCYYSKIIKRVKGDINRHVIISHLYLISVKFHRISQRHTVQFPNLLSMNVSPKTNLHVSFARCAINLHLKLFAAALLLFVRRLIAKYFLSTYFRCNFLFSTYPLTLICSPDPEPDPDPE